MAAAATQESELYDRVAELRAEVFDVLEHVSHGKWLNDSEALASAAAGLQSVANQLGAVERLFSRAGPPRPDGAPATAGARDR